MCPEAALVFKDAFSLGGGGALLAGTLFDLVGHVVGGGGEGVGGGGVGGFGEFLGESGAAGTCTVEAYACVWWGGCFGGSGRLGGHFVDLWGTDDELHTWGAFFDRESITWISVEACDLCVFNSFASSGLTVGCGGGVGFPLAVALLVP